MLFSKVIAPVFVSYSTLPMVQETAFFSPSSQAFVIPSLFDYSHSSRWEVLPPCGFDLSFPDW